MILDPELSSRLAPLGVGLLWRHFGVRPDRVLLAHGTYGLDRTANSAPYDVVATLTFARKQDADRFIDVFETPAAALLQGALHQGAADRRSGRAREPDLDDLLARSEDVLAATSR